MAYTLLEQYSSNFYGGPMVPKGITIHWWGDPAQKPTFYGIVNVLLERGRQQSASVHFVAEAGLVACLVSPTFNSWGNGDGGAGWGNLNTITIECNPRCTPGDRETVAELIADQRRIWGPLPLYPHNRWTNTQCPGVWEQYLGWLDARANQILTGGGSAATPQPAPAPVKPSVTSSRLYARTVTQDVAWVRTAPSAAAPKAPGYADGIKKGSTILVSGYVKGQDPFKTGDDAWFKTKSGFYVWVNAAQNDYTGVPYLGDMSGSATPQKPAPAPVKPSTPKRGPNDIHWIVERGDTLDKIAKYYYGPSAGTVEVNKIATHNGIKNINSLSVGQKVYIPGPMVWTIEAPDTYSSIAAYYGLDPDYLARKNGDANRHSEIYIGNTIQIIP